MCFEFIRQGLNSSSTASEPNDLSKLFNLSEFFKCVCKMGETSEYLM